MAHKDMCYFYCLFLGDVKERKKGARKMKKEELIALGVSEEHADKIVSCWNEALKGYIQKSEYDTKVQELETTQQQLETANQTSHSGLNV